MKMPTLATVHFATVNVCPTAQTLDGLGMLTAKGQAR
jgi:hypothetical protein